MRWAEETEVKKTNQSKCENIYHHNDYKYNFPLLEISIN